MSRRQPRVPRMEPLESRRVMSSGAQTAPAATANTNHVPTTATLASGHELNKQQDAEARTLELTGQATGVYTSTAGNSRHGMRDAIDASGTISPIGAAIITGTFDSAAGSLTLIGAQGALHLELKARNPSAHATRTSPVQSINPGGPMIPAGQPATESPISDPVILVYTFHFEIKSGTGQDSRVRGTGTVEIQTTPAFISPPATGIDSSSLALEHPTGRITMSFSQIRPTLTSAVQFCRNATLRITRSFARIR
jgi:hypothetical protein